MRICFFDLFLSFMDNYSCACVYRCRSMEAGRYHQLLFSLSVVEQCSKSRNVINREVLDDSNSRARSEYNWLVVDRKMMEWKSVGMMKFPRYGKSSKPPTREGRKESPNQSSTNKASWAALSYTNKLVWWFHRCVWWQLQSPVPIFVGNGLTIQK